MKKMNKFKVFDYLIEESSLFIEEIDSKSNQLVNTFSLITSKDEIIDWYISEYGTSYFEDTFNPWDGHDTKQYNLTEEEIDDIPTNDKNLIAFAMAHQNKWVKCNI
jgi:hypothetical protein